MMVSRKSGAINSRRHDRTLRTQHLGVLGRRAAILLHILMVVLVWGVGTGNAPGQEQKHKVPGLSKLGSGSNQEAFNGIVQSLDLKRKILSVNTLQGQATEIFPIPKNIDLVTASGSRRELTALKPGTNVFILFEQKGDRRTVKQIVILAAAPKAAKKATPSS